MDATMETPTEATAKVVKEEPMIDEEKAEQLKNEGNELFRLQRYYEAIIKYKDGLEYITQMPTEFLTQKVYDLRHQFNLNITNCHIALNEYNYAMKSLNEAFTINKTPKCHYFRAVSI